MPFMQFQINTPQSVGASIAVKESRKASKRKAAYAPELQPSPKKQKSVHGSVPSAPTASPAPAPSQIQGHPITLSGPTEEVATLADAAPCPAQTQAHNAADFSPAGDVTRKRKPDDFSPSSVQGNQRHNVTDLEPAPKKQKLSSATLLSTKAWKRLSSEESARVVARNLERRLESWSRDYGHDYQILNISPDDVLTHPDFRAPPYLLAQTASNHSNIQGPPDRDLYPSDDSSIEKLISGTPRLGTRGAPNLGIPAPKLGRPAPEMGVLAPKMGAPGPPWTGSSEIAERLYFEAENHKPTIVQKITAKAWKAMLNSDQASTPLSSINSKSQSPTRYSSDFEVLYEIIDTSSDRSASVSSVYDVAEDTAATSSEQSFPDSSGRDTGHDTPIESDHIAPLPSKSTLSDSFTNATSTPISPVGPPRNRGGRPKGRKPRPAKPFKTPKGPMRFQKNHPVKAAVNVDIWENILSFCPPDFLLKARTISSTFWSVLKDDSPIWKISRVKHFGSDMPGPPSGLSEPQYADLLTGTGCQTRGCTSKKTRKTYWAFQRRLCMDCFHQAFLPPRAVRKVYKELEVSEMPQYRSIAQYYQNMEEFLPGLKFDRWDNYQWLGDYDPTPAWGQVYRSGQYVAFPASAYASFSSEIADLVGNVYDVKEGRFSSLKPMPGKTCPPQDEVDAWFDIKRVANDTLVSELQAVENWYETYKRNNQKLCKDLREDRDAFYKEQAELAGFDKGTFRHFDCYKAAIAISKPATMQSWNILLPKLKAEREKQEGNETDAFLRGVEKDMNYEWSPDELNDHGRSA